MASEEHWRQFQGTELGSLMTQIYGNKAAQERVRYPRPGRASPFAPSESFVSSGNPGRGPKPRTPRKVAVPSFGQPVVANRAKIESVPKRRNESVIRSEMDEIRLRQTHYRPPPSKAVTDADKERFREICVHKGGRALPETCLPPPGDAPFEIRQRLQERKRLEDLKARRNPQRALAPSEMSVEDKLAQQLVDEIEERRVYLEEMRGLGGLTHDLEAKLKAEIALRLREMQNLKSSDFI